VTSLTLAIQTLQNSLTKLQENHALSTQMQHQFQRSGPGLHRVCSFCGLTEDSSPSLVVGGKAQPSTVSRKDNSNLCSARRPESPVFTPEQMQAIQQALEQLQANGITLFPHPASPTASSGGSPLPLPSPTIRRDSMTPDSMDGSPLGLGSHPQHVPHTHNCVKSAIVAGLRNFAAGVGVKAAVALVPHLMALKWPKFTALWNRSTFRFGLFLGGFAFIYKALNCSISATLKESGRIPSFLAGAVAACSIFALEPRDRTPIAVYLFVRAMVIVGHAASHQPWYPRSLAQFRHTDILLMCLSACQILFAYIFEQDTLPTSYLKFLLQAGRQDQRIISLVARTGRNEPQDVAALDSYVMERKIVPPFTSWKSVLDKTARVLDQKEPGCSLMHPGQSCMTHYFYFVLKHFFQYSLRFYVPLNLVSAVLFRSKEIRKDPYAAVKSVIRSCIRSSSFLALYCGNAWLMCCLLRQANILNGLSTWCLVGPAAGVALGLEAKSRRLELAIYCMSPALQSLYRCLRKWNVLPKIHYLDYFFFAIAMGVIMSAMQNDHHHMLYYYPSLSKIMKSLIGIDSTEPLMPPGAVM